MKDQSSDFVHPELRAGELFFMNASVEDFQGMELATKRRGLAAYDGKGNDLKTQGWLPIFIREEELLGFPGSLNTLRAKYRRRIERNS